MSQLTCIYIHVLCPLKKKRKISKNIQSVHMCINNFIRIPFTPNLLMKSTNIRITLHSIEYPFQTVNMASELRKPVYWSVSVRVIEYDKVLHNMATVKWDVKEIMSQHNPYIDILLQVTKSLSE